MTPVAAEQQHSNRLLSCDEILKIARQDGETAYRDLSAYRITLDLQEDGWHVDFDLTKPLVAGGGPHYVIHPADGAILWKRYDQ
jgi:hypothetical protein